MAHLIDKDSLVAEIERLREVLPLDEFQPEEQNKIDWLAGKLFTINSLDFFLDTLEVKEVDLEKEFDDFLDNIVGVPDIFWHYDKQIEWAKDIAKHFFEIGLRVNNEKGK